MNDRIAHPPGVRPGISINHPTVMAWRPYQNVINGELDNRIPGKVTGWIRFYRRGAVPLRATFDLAGDFHEDIRGKVIRISNPAPSDRNEELEREGTYMDGFASVQRGQVGDITAGIALGPWTPELAERLLAERESLWEKNGVSADERERRRKGFIDYCRERIASGEPYYPYVAYPYIEWYADNGRVVLELEPSQVEILGEDAAVPKTPQEHAAARITREEAMLSFVENMVKGLSDENRKKGGDGSVTGIVVN